MSSVKDLQQRFGEEAWHDFIKLCPEWAVDLKTQSKARIRDVLTEGFAKEDADQYSGLLFDYFEAEKRAEGAAGAGEAPKSGSTGVKKGNASPGRQRALSLRDELRDKIKDAVGITLSTTSESHGTLHFGQYSDGRKVAVKITRAKTEISNAQIVREKFSDARNIVPYLDVVVLEGVGDDLNRADSVALVMPLMDTTLAEASRQSAFETVNIEEGAAGIIEALDQIHRAGYVHMDVKASNIFVLDGGRRWLLGDFGSLTKIGGEPTSCTDRYLPQGVDIVADPAVDFEMLRTTLALLVAAKDMGGDTAEAMKAADKELGYRPLPQVRDDMLHRGDAGKRLAGVTERLDQLANSPSG
jgi:serine/threonine protein kinase